MFFCKIQYSIFTILFFLVSPFTILIFDLATLYSLLSISISFLLASPSTGGEVNFTFKSVSDSLITLFKDDLGITLIFRRIFNKRSAYVCVVIRKIRVYYFGKSTPPFDQGLQRIILHKVFGIPFIKPFFLIISYPYSLQVG